jgi:transcriptional regulator with XRE-family HTH domain
MPQPAKYTLPDVTLSAHDIGANITKARKQRGLSQKELSEKIGITQALLSHYETGKRIIPVEIVVQISISLNTSTDFLLGKDSSTKTDSHLPSRRVLQRLQKIENLPPNQQKVLLKNIDMFLKAAETED